MDYGGVSHSSLAGSYPLKSFIYSKYGRWVKDVHVDVENEAGFIFDADSSMAKAERLPSLPGPQWTFHWVGETVIAEIFNRGHWRGW